MPKDLAGSFRNAKPSIHALIVEAALARGSAAKSLDLTLPEQGETGTGRGLRFVGGGLDALVGGRDTSKTQTKARTLVASVTKAARHPSATSLSALYERLKVSRASEIVDETLSRLQPELSRDRSSVAAIARKLVLEAPDIEPAKLGVALLGVSGDSNDAELLIEIGQSEEMTLYSVVALSNLLRDPEVAIFSLAQKVHGWGRIAAVERLVETRNDTIRAWLLRDGFRNEIMYEYLACLAARTGGLHEALSASDIDDELLCGASDIISALILGGPAEDILDYDDGAEACVSFLRHAIVSDTPELSTVSTVVELKQLVDGARGEQLRSTKGWTAQAIFDVRAYSAALLQKPGARAAVIAGLASDEPWGAPLIAAAIAPQFGIDPWPRYLERQQRRIGEHWWHLMQTDDTARIEQVLQLAREQLDLVLVGSGPGDSIGLGLEYRDDSALDFVVQDLRRFPAQGWDLIEIALKARTIRLRNMAINALRDWGRATWSEGTERAVKNALEREPDPDLRDRFRLLLAGKLKDDG